MVDDTAPTHGVSPSRGKGKQSDAPRPNHGVRFQEVPPTTGKVSASPHPSVDGPSSQHLGTAARKSRRSRSRGRSRSSSKPRRSHNSDGAPRPPQQGDPTRLPQQQQKQRSWASVARVAEKGYNLPFFPPFLVDGKPIARIPADVLNETNPKWSECIVGYYAGKRLPFKLTADSIKNAWGDKLVDVMANEEGFYFFHVPDESFRSRILENGPISIARVPLVLQQWHVDLELKRESFESVPVWVRLKDVPYALWSPSGIGYIASVIGQPLHVDLHTDKLSRIGFARACVVVRADKPLMNSVVVEWRDRSWNVPVEYEGKPVPCAGCGRFGHKCTGIADASVGPNDTTLPASVVGAAAASSSAAVGTTPPQIASPVGSAGQPSRLVLIPNVSPHSSRPCSPQVSSPAGATFAAEMHPRTQHLSVDPASPALSAARSPPALVSPQPTSPPVMMIPDDDAVVTHGTAPDADVLAPGQALPQASAQGEGWHKVSRRKNRNRSNSSASPGSNVVLSLATPDDTPAPLFPQQNAGTQGEIYAPGLSDESAAEAQSSSADEDRRDVSSNVDSEDDIEGSSPTPKQPVTRRRAAMHLSDSEVQQQPLIQVKQQTPRLTSTTKGLQKPRSSKPPSSRRGGNKKS